MGRRMARRQRHDRVPVGGYCPAPRCRPMQSSGRDVWGSANTPVQMRVRAAQHVVGGNTFCGALAEAEMPVVVGDFRCLGMLISRGDCQ
jgi:hypothetical protein